MKILGLVFLILVISLPLFCQTEANPAGGIWNKFTQWIAGLIGGGTLIGVVWRIIKLGGEKIQKITARALDLGMELLQFMGSILKGLLDVSRQISEAEIELSRILAFVDEKIKSDKPPEPEELKELLEMIKNLKKEIGDVKPALDVAYVEIKNKFTELVNKD